MRRKWWLISFFILGLILFVYFLADIPFTQTFALLADASLIEVTAYLFCSFAFLAGCTLGWDVLMDTDETDIPYPTLLNYRMADHAVSFLTPGPRVGGELARAHLLTLHDFTIPEGIANSGVEKLLKTAGDFVFFLTTAFIFSLTIDFQPVVRGIIIGITLLGLAITGVLMRYVHTDTTVADMLYKLFIWLETSTVEKYETKLREFEEAGKRYIRDHPRTCLAVIGIDAIARSFTVLEMYFLTQMMGLQIQLYHAYLLALFIYVAYALPVMMGVGVLEAGQVTAFALLNLPTNVGVLVAVFTRGRDFLWSAWGIAALGYYGVDFKSMFENS
jgi:uncharacterized protein (TIRG00374 family)